MNISKYANIIAIAKYGNIATAAEHLFISRTALNRQLIAVEEELGAKLFERDAQKFLLTQSGRIFLESAIAIVNEENECRKMLDDINCFKRGILNVGIPTSWSTMLFSDVMNTFKAEYPGITIELTIAASKVLSNKLIDHEIDIAVMSLEHVCNDFEYENIMTSEYLVMMSKQHPKANLTGFDSDGKRLQCNLRWFKDDHWAVDAPGSTTRAICESLFLAEKIKPKILVDNCIYSVQMELVNAGLCLSIAVDTLMPKYENITGFSLNPRKSFTLVAAKRKEYKYSIPEQRFIEIFAEVGKKKMCK